MNGDKLKKEDGVNGKSGKQLEVLMWGYFLGVTVRRSPLTSPASIRFPELEEAEDSWKDVCAADAVSAWQSNKGEVYTWGWKECVPSVKITRNWTTMKNYEDETLTRQSSALTDQVSSPNDTIPGDETLKRRKVVPQQDFETSMLADETLPMPPCPVNLDPGVRITSVAAGGRHTLALSGKLLLCCRLQTKLQMWDTYGVGAIEEKASLVWGLGLKWWHLLILYPILTHRQMEVTTLV